MQGREEATVTARKTARARVLPSSAKAHRTPE